MDSSLLHDENIWTYNKQIMVYFKKHIHCWEMMLSSSGRTRVDKKINISWHAECMKWDLTYRGEVRWRRIWWVKGEGQIFGMEITKKCRVDYARQSSGMTVGTSKSLREARFRGISHVVNRFNLREQLRETRNCISISI